MRLFLVGLVFFSSTMLIGAPPCNLEIKTSITHTSDAKDNGKIDVTIIKGEAPYKVFLFAEKRKDNRQDIKFKDLNDLASGRYILIIQDAGGCTVQETLNIK